MITGAQAMVMALEQENVSTVFGYPGAAICPFYDALLDSSIRHILTRHEQGAAHAANGFARATGQTGVCVATSGPGSTNLITGIATAYMDSIPVVIITGQVATDLIGSDSFQEVDITGAASPFTKHTYLVRKANDLPRIFKEAFHIASTGRPGPVLLDIPIDVQTDSFDYRDPGPVNLPGYQPVVSVDPQMVIELGKLLTESKRPIICSGGGVISAGATPVLRTVAETYKIPVVTTLMGIGSLPCDHPNNLGTLGSHGVFAANYALHQSDLVILLGARVGNRAMGSAAEIARKAKIVHVDIDPAEIGKNISTHLAIIGDCSHVLESLRDLALPLSFSDWFDKIRAVRLESRYDQVLDQPSQSIHPPTLMHHLGQQTGPDTIITTEVGQNQIWASNHFPIRKPRTFLTSGGMGTMGYGLPASIGAKAGCPDQTVLAISGDGSLQMSLQELGTIRQERIDVKIVLLNNSRLGMVHELQSLKYKRYSQVFLEENPDFKWLARAYNLGYGRLESNDQIQQAVSDMLAYSGPYLLECTIDPHEPTLYPRKKESQ